MGLRMPVTLYLLRSDACPDFGHETEMIILHEEGYSPPSDPFPRELYACMTTLVTTYDDSPAFREAVTAWWQELSGVDPVLEPLTTELSLMSPDQRETILELDPESWSVRSNVVAYPKGAPDAEAEARSLILESALSQH